MKKPFYVLVCGGRGFNNKGMMADVLHGVMTNRSIYDSDDQRMVIVHGNARGADQMAGDWAAYWDMPVFAIPAEWNRLGPHAAGPHRNSQMLNWLDIGHVVAFPGGTGTADMVARAQRASIPVLHAFEDF